MSIPTIEENVVKKISVSLLALLLISASAAFAQQEGVYSANALGYIKKTVPPEGKMTCVTIPLHSLTDGTNVFGRTTLAQQLPAGSVVFFWNPTNQAWSGGTKSTKGWSPAQSNRVVAATEAFFLREAGSGLVWSPEKPYTWP